MGGKPMKRLLLADALGLSPSSNDFRDLLSSSNKYGFTGGNKESDEIPLTPVGADATQGIDKSKRLRTLRTATLRSPVFGQFFRDYANKRVPSSEMIPKILRPQYQVPDDLADECAALISTNGRYVEIIRDIGESPHVLLDAELTQLAANTDEQGADRTAFRCGSSARQTSRGSFAAAHLALAAYYELSGSQANFRRPRQE
jgi:hypothetical protein